MRQTEKEPNRSFIGSEKGLSADHRSNTGVRRDRSILQVLLVNGSGEFLCGFGRVRRASLNGGK
jgi:hypothetical protein